MNKRFPFVPEGWSLDLYKDVAENSVYWYFAIRTRIILFNFLLENDHDAFDLTFTSPENKGYLNYFFSCHPWCSIKAKDHGRTERIIVRHSRPITPVKEIDADGLNSLFNSLKDSEPKLRSAMDRFINNLLSVRASLNTENLSIKELEDRVISDDIMKQVTPPPAYDVLESFYIKPMLRIDLNAPEEEILLQFQSWLRAAQADRAVAQPKHRRNKKPKITHQNFRAWARDRVLPYIDLRHFAMRHGWVETTWSFDGRKKGNRVAVSEWVDLVYPDAPGCVSDENFTKNTVKPAQWLMSDPAAFQLLRLASATTAAASAPDNT